MIQFLHTFLFFFKLISHLGCSVILSKVRALVGLAAYPFLNKTNYCTCQSKTPTLSIITIFS